MSGYFGPELFAFLGELAAHNDRTWFAASKARYREHVEAPMKRFVEDAGIQLGELSPCYAQGSMFRIHRDTRFSKDKTPYKTNVAASFHHEAGRRRDHGVPGFYVHLAPGHCIGAGCTTPPRRWCRASASASSPGRRSGKRCSKAASRSPAKRSNARRPATTRATGSSRT